MKKLAVFTADGLEETECLATVDILRRAGITAEMISLNDERLVKGAHGICFYADKCANEFSCKDYDGVVLPGGMPGTVNLSNSTMVIDAITQFDVEKKLIAAICAAPSVPGSLGLLDKKNATCYPGFEDKLKGALTREKSVVRDGNFITSRGVGTVIDFALEIVSYMVDSQTAKKIAKGIVYNA